MPFGSFASLALVGCMWYMGVPLGVCIFVRRECQLVTPVSHSGARCFRSLLEKWMGMHCCLTNVSYSLVPMVHWIVCRFCWRLSLVASEAIRKDAAMSLSRMSGGSFLGVGL